MVDTNLKRVDKYTFSLNNVLGAGSFGKVYKGSDEKTGQQVAVKVIAKALIENDEYLMQGLQQEVQVMSKLKSSNIVQLLGVLETTNNYYIVQEYCDGGDLRGLQKKKKILNESESLFIIQDILSGFIELLQHGIIHRDLKPENILIHQGRYKIADFGFAKTVDNYNKQLLTSLVGTPLYMAPQILKQEKYTTKSDIWSIGLIYYELLCGATPWPATSQYQLVTNIYKNPILYPAKFNVSQNSKSFINQCLEISEDERISWNDIYKHPLFGEHFTDQKSHDQELENKALFILSQLRSIIHSQNLDLTQLFTHYANKNNQIEYKSFQQLMAEIDATMLPNEVDYLFNKFDSNSNQTIGFEEFSKEMEGQNIRMSAIPNINRIQKQPSQTYESTQEVNKELEKKVLLCNETLVYAINKFKISVDKLFGDFDKQKTNFLGLAQFQELINMVSKDKKEKPTIDVIHLAFEKFDRDGDGKISLPEFKQAIQDYEQKNPELKSKQ